MLVLSRREDQTIVFPDLGITVRVLRPGKHHVRLGIEAPESIRILRGELAVGEPETRSVEFEVV